MRTLTVVEMESISGGDDPFLKNLGQCTVDTLVGGAAGAALGVATGGVAMTPLVILGLIAGNLGSNACNAL